MSVGLKETLANHPVSLEGKVVFCRHRFQRRWGTADFDWGHVWRWKEYLKDRLNPVDMPILEEAEAENFGVGLSITQAEVTEVVDKLLGARSG